LRVIKVQSWTQSEPPRGSGWVHAQHEFIEHVYDVPTRCREMVLTVSKIQYEWG